MDFHGGNIYKVFREKKIKEILDYSSNINPLGIPGSLKKLIFENINILERYPDPEYVELRKKIAEKNEVNIENIIVGNGATEIIFLFIKALNPKKILIISPTFSEYERALAASKINKNDIEINYFKLDEKEDFNLNIENLTKELDKNYNLVILCNPNNPTGKFLEISKIEKILKKCNEMETKLFIDEAFIEFVESWKEKTAIKIKENKKNLFIIRAFTKFFAIPGLRLGYGICFDDGIIKKMLEKKEPWSVNNFADIAGIALLDDIEYIKNTENWIKEEKKYMFEKLSEISGIEAYKTDVNFILIKIKNELFEKGLNVKKVRESMMEKGILIRDASNFIFLDERYFRLAIKDRKNNDRVLENLKEVLKSLE